MQKSKVKICGLKTLKDVEAVNKYMPDYVGFVFAHTKRYVTDEQALEMKKHLSSNIKAVGVFVNEPIEHIVELCSKGIIDLVQIHGDEDEKYLSQLRAKLPSHIEMIRALRVKSKEYIVEMISEIPDYMLFDAYQKGVYGGSGERFNLDILDQALEEIRDNGKVIRPYFIAGGLECDNVLQIIDSTKCFGVDISSGLETDGSKDEEKISRFMLLFRH